MGFDRIREFKKVAGTYTGPFIESDDLAIKCRESSPKAWVKVRNNNKKTWEGEQRKEILDENGKIKEIWMYRPTDNYDEVLFSLLYLRFEKTIYATWRKLYGKVDLDDYLTATEDWLCQAIRHYSKDKGHFAVLGNSMISMCAVNLINKNTTITRTRDPETKQLIDKKVNYHILPTSLDAMMEDEEGLSYLVPSSPEPELDVVKILKEKYKSNGDLIVWSLLDMQLDESEILSQRKLFPIIDKYKKFTAKSFKDVYTSILTTGTYKDFGFNKPELVDTFDQIDKLNENTEDKTSQKNKALNKEYKRCITVLQKEARDNELCK